MKFNQKKSLKGNCIVETVVPKLGQKIFETQMTLRQILADFLRHELFSLGSLSRSKSISVLTVKAQTLGVEKAISHALAIEVLDDLVLTGDIGAWTSFGEPMVLLLDRRMMPVDGQDTIILGGPPMDGDPFGILRRIATDTVFEQEAFEFRPELSEAETQSIAALVDLGEWSPALALSPGLRRVLLHLGCEPDGKLSRHADDFLKEWLQTVTALSQGGGLDVSQQVVVSQEKHARLVVTAGPGCGKTHTASARVIELVKSGVSPASIHLITFTRVAAQEISERVKSALADQVYGAGIQCFTLDSFAWHLIGSIEDQDTSGGFDKSILRASALLSAREQRLLDWVGRIGHLVIDEAQDVVGIRQKLSIQLIAALPASVGVTVFGDWAQAIYGAWSDQNANVSQPASNLHAHILASEGWKKLELSFNHRAGSAKLKAFALDARACLGNIELQAKERYLLVRELLENAASTQGADLLDRRIPWSFDNLILTRSRMAAEAASARLSLRGRPHRLKLSGHTHVVEPLIGAICAGKTVGEPLTQGDVEQRIEALSPAPFGWTPDEAFVLLKSVAGTGKAAPRLSDIIVKIEQSPVHITHDYIGQSGPLIGSVHGAKGKEAEDVFFLMPPIPNYEDVDWDEEARVLFVAGSRASKRLHLGRTRQVFGRVEQDGSRWISGQDGGLALSGSDGLTPLPGRGPVDAIWGATFDQPLCTFRRESVTSEWQLVLQNGHAVATAIDPLAMNLNYLANEALSLPFGSLRVAGATTVATTRRDGKPIGVALLPVLQGTVRSGSQSSEKRIT
ncbi:AAA family ATPase [Marivivens sp. LCG002]|uniref:UvrD-helicase domain-containing protein n=1 Tax=Marivivens sp. LCG002 TaxID=3051171 RepID=UPI002555A000|nr:UvrD-helicase domain-containing protein [Marivivens sp. LCG002]WIV50273.1 AAA family ATPase [Marivivens sp. LCG002]